MPTIIINDVEVEARMGERLLNVARRNAAHIGFVCDGNGICQTCQCRVIAGAQYLSPPNEAERTWLPERRLRAGYRLACQTGLRGPGPVRVITAVEELRRQSADLVRDDGRGLGERAEPLVDNLVQLNVDQLLLFPWNVIRTVLRVGPLKMLFPWNGTEGLSRWLEDGGRVARHVAAAPTPSATLPAPPSAAPGSPAAVSEAVERLRAAQAERRRVAGR